MPSSDPKKTVPIVPSSRVDELLARIPQFTMRYVAAIAFGPEDGRPRNVATVTAVEMAGARFLVTARHVVDCDAATREPWKLLVPVRDQAGRVPHRMWAKPEFVPLKPSDVIWRSDANDVAVMRSPPRLALDFFDGGVAARKTTRVRETWDEAADQEAYRPVVTSGFPMFARLMGSEAAGFGLISLPGAIVHASRSGQSTMPIINLNLGCKKVKTEEVGGPEAVIFARQLDHSEVPLGGLSGAPVVVVTESAFHLVGIFIEGNQNLETGRAVPWDAVYSEYLDSLALPPPVAVT